MSEQIIDGKVIPYEGGRKCRDTLKWRDATALELEQAERIAELEEKLREIREFAHDRSTGPAVPDALWEIRAMASAA